MQDLMRVWCYALALLLLASLLYLPACGDDSNDDDIQEPPACFLTAIDCPSHQTFDIETCTCYPPAQEFCNLDCTAPYTRDRDRCNCTCGLRDKDCPTGYQANPSTCSCACDLQPEDCLSGQVPDLLDCACVYRDGPPVALQPPATFALDFSTGEFLQPHGLGPIVSDAFPLDSATTFLHFLPSESGQMTMQSGLVEETPVSWMKYDILALPVEQLDSALVDFSHNPRIIVETPRLETVFVESTGWLPLILADYRLTGVISPDKETIFDLEIRFRLDTLPLIESVGIDLCKLLPANCDDDRMVEVHLIDMEARSIAPLELPIEGVD